MQPLILPHKGVMPTIADDVFVAPNATVIGDVAIGEGASIWYNTVVRGDSEKIRIGARTNIQDNCTIHVTNAGPDKLFPCLIGADILIGHNVVAHGCTLEDTCFIGMKSTILDGAVVEGGAMVAAGALLTPGKVVKSGEMWAGSPARKVRGLAEDEIAAFQHAVDHYCENARQHIADIQAFHATKD